MLDAVDFERDGEGLSGGLQPRLVFTVERRQ